jgi:hypothetical protein
MKQAQAKGKIKIRGHTRKNGNVKQIVQTDEETITNNESEQDRKKA